MRDASRAGRPAGRFRRSRPDWPVAVGGTTHRSLSVAIALSVTAHLVAPIREARRVAMMNMLAAGMAVVAAGLALWASL